MEDTVKYGSAVIKVFNSQSEFQTGGADFIKSKILECTASEDKCSIALSGGSTPKNIYKLLAEPGYSSRIPWRKVYLFWGDERFVPPTDHESNFKMANENLISKIPIPPENVFRVKAEKSPEEAAEEYERKLKQFFGNVQLPEFSVILLGLGEEGHTASLFPGSRAIGEAHKWVVNNYVEKLGAERITLTFPVINNAGNIVFLVSGKGKAEIVKKVLTGNGDNLPAEMINPKQGYLTWLLDKDAASEL
jgi:6-phosphogluconolactonase